VASADGAEVEKAPEPVDMVALVAAVCSEATEWGENVRAAVTSAVTGEKQVEFEADAAHLQSAACLFQDTPDDLCELL